MQREGEGCLMQLKHYDLEHYITFFCLLIHHGASNKSCCIIYNMAPKEEPHVVFVLWV